MAGPGIAIRLHEFKETASLNTATSPNRVARQGRDTLGLYPGQLGRVHVAPSTNYRGRFACGELRSEPLRESREHYPESFDLQTLRALQLTREMSGGPDGRSTATSHQEAFGSLSYLYPAPNDRRFTAVSHPAPLSRTDPTAI
ncbi:hypothetical protein SKAU_G00148940 [Synaphobranchus kaupii]|uniref:Uncharacterized protein n=1 Tax=Synaphobranchus kaupii TaxID=118154 RepID=A0A9Q1J517_SYNKA|nr:hypothetical protein SKAU_G00148940 [Synaphobranchus kaupii]